MGWRLRKQVIAGIAILLLLAVPLWAGQYIVYVMDLVGIFTLVAIGLNLLSGYAGQISLGHAAFFAIGAYSTGILSQKLGLPFWATLPIAGFLACLISLTIALPTMRLKGLYLAIATLGFGVVVQKLLFEWRPLTGGGAGLTIEPPSIGPLVLATDSTMFYLIFFITSVGLWTASNYTRLKGGRAILMLRENEIAASCLGISIARTKLEVLSLSAFYTAVAGGLYAYLVKYINAESFSFSLSIAFFSMIVIGGLGSIPGSALGAAFYVIVPEILRGFKDAHGLVFGISLIVAMIFMPRGLWGVVEVSRERRLFDLGYQFRRIRKSASKTGNS